MNDAAPPNLLLFVVLTLGWMFCVGMGSATVAVGLALWAGDNPALLTPTELIPPWLLALSAATQAGGLGLLMIAAAWRSGPRYVLAAGPSPSALWWAAAGLGALTVGWLPGWLATQLMELLPAGGTLDMLSEHIANSSTPTKVLLTLAICLAAPFGEELAFRGFLWHHLQRLLPHAVVWLGTSLLFMAYHADPVQSVCLLPTALFFGLLRWRSGHIGPCVLAHMVNNGVAMTSMFAGFASVPSLGWALGGTLWWLGLMFVAELLTRQRT